MIRRLGTALLDVVYPPICAGCDRRGTWLCTECLPTVAPFGEPLCNRCGAPVALAWCQCDSLHPALHQVRSALPYRGWVAEAVGAFKYRDETARARSLAEWLVPWLLRFGEVDALIAVPLHPRRRRQRGYNQAELLANELRRMTGTPSLALLERTRSTSPQVGTHADDRYANVARAFATDVRQVMRSGGRFVLVDDVRTTGATLSACAEALALAAPTWIGALTVAWTMPDPVEARWRRLSRRSDEAGE